MTRSSSDIRDELLVLAAQEGDPAALGTVLRGWLPALRRHALRLTGDEQAAEDVAQEACHALVRGLARLGDPSSARAWIFRVASNKAADWVRRRRRERRLAGPEFRQHREPGEASSDPVMELERARRVRALREACSVLPAELLVPVSLHYGEGLPLAEIAAALEVPVGTIKSRLHEARSRLRAHLERSMP